VILVVLNAATWNFEVVIFAGLEDCYFAFGVGDDDTNGTALLVRLTRILANDFGRSRFACLEFSVIVLTERIWRLREGQYAILRIWDCFVAVDREASVK
jgi:hypothetical protein